MGCNGAYGLFGSGYMGDFSYFRQNPYLPVAGYLTSTLNDCPGNIWAARNWTQAAQGWTHCAAYPYGFSANFTGRRTQYYVADPNQMSYQTALGLQTGQVYGGMSAPQLADYFSQRADRFVVDISASMTASNLHQAKSIGECKNKDYMKAEENKELREEAIKLEKQAEELLKEFDEVMKDSNSLSTSELKAKVDVYAKKAKELVGETDELYKRIKDAETAYSKKKTEEAEAAAEEAAEQAGSGDGSSPSVDGETTVTTTEGDKELKTNDALSKEYGVKEPIIESDQDVASVAAAVKRNTNNSNDKKNHDDFMNMFTTKEINAGNIVEILNELGTYDLYDGIYEMDNSAEAMDKVLSVLRERVTALKTDGFLTDAEAKEIKDALSAVQNKLGNGTDIPSSSPKIDAFGKKSLNVNTVLRTIAAKLEGKGTQADFDKKIEAKKTERETKATKDFYGAHAKTKTGKSVKDEKAALPDGVTYLPNSKQFQWKCGDNVFKGETYSKLNDAVLKCGKADVIANWNEVLKKLDENLK